MKIFHYEKDSLLAGTSVGAGSTSRGQRRDISSLRHRLVLPEVKLAVPWLRGVGRLSKGWD